MRGEAYIAGFTEGKIDGLNQARTHMPRKSTAVKKPIERGKKKTPSAFFP